MSDIEDMLKANKTQIEKIEVPSELESRLRRSLNRKKAPFYKRFKLQVAVLIVMTIMITLNYDAIASYSKKLLGYDQVMSGTLKELSELGKGQFIGESYTFADGLTVTVDYVMLDENQLLLFYTLKNPKGDVENNNLSHLMSIKGLWKEYRFQNSIGNLNEELTEIKYVTSFEPPGLLDKKLSLHFSHEVDGKNVPAEINFILNRKTAMGHTLKKDINKMLQLDEVNLRFDSVLASPTKTVIKGSMQNIFGLAIDTLSGERFRPIDLTIKLIANGKEVNLQGGGMSTDMKGITFHKDFDALPSNLNDLKIELVSFSADHDINKQFELEQGGNQTLDILGQKIKINEIKANNDETLIKITSEEGVLLTKVYLMIDGEKVSLEEAIEDEFDKTDGKIMHTRTLRFLKSGKELSLDIQRMSYSQEYNQIIEIPIN